MERNNERVIVFIDGSNLFHAMQRLNVKIDYIKLVDALVKDRYLIRPYFYSSTSVPPSQSQLMFHQALTHQGFTIKTKPLQKRGQMWIEKGVEIMIAGDMLMMAFRDLYDTAILVSGDGDFLSVINEIKRLGKRTEVAAFSSGINMKLKTSSDIFIGLDNLISEIQRI